MLDYPVIFPSENVHSVLCQTYKEQHHNLLHRAAFIMSHQLSYFLFAIEYPKCQESHFIPTKSSASYLLV